MGAERKFPGRKPTRWAWGGGRGTEKPRDDVRRVWLAGEMGVERSFQRRKPTRWVYRKNRSGKNPEMACVYGIRNV
jgi:hypothetical protein